MPFREPGLGPEGIHFILVPFPPGWSCQAGITRRRALAENDFIWSLQLGKLRPPLSPTLPLLSLDPLGTATRTPGR